jgi:hypothetical protein
MATTVLNLTSADLILPLPVNQRVPAGGSLYLPYVEYDVLTNDPRFADMIARAIIRLDSQDNRVDTLEVKAEPVGLDYLEIADSEADWAKKKATLASLIDMIPVATITTPGLMSALDKTHLEELLAMLDTPAVQVADYATTTSDLTPTVVTDGFPLPITGFKETIVFAATIMAAGAATITGIVWLWQALATVPAWYPLRSITLGNEAVVVADTDQLVGSVAEITWPRGVTRVTWQTISETGTPSDRNITITA